jgi:hypothetical protein
MTNAKHLLATRAWCEKWMAVPADQLPGTLTHEKIAQVSIETECDLIDHARWGDDGKIHYE